MTNPDNPAAAPARRCILCGRPISPARVEALPGVTTCIACAQKYPRQVRTDHLDLSQSSPINRNGFAPTD
jgi:hypothetical protein